MHVRSGSVPVDTCAEPYGVAIVVVLRLETRYGTALISDCSRIEFRVGSNRIQVVLTKVAAARQISRQKGGSRKWQPNKTEWDE